MSANKDDKEANRSPPRSARSSSGAPTATSRTSNSVTSQTTQPDDGKEEKSVKIFVAKLKDSDLTPSERALVTGQLAHHLATGICALAIFAMFLIIAICEIIVGALNIDNCPVKKMIPIWLIVSGSSSCLRYILAIGLAIVDRNGESVAVVRAWIEVFFSLFWFVWFILGSVWIYSVYNEVTLIHGKATQTPSHGQSEKYFFWLVFCCCLICCAAVMIANQPPSERKSHKSEKLCCKSETTPELLLT
ncbi:hypothetical protein GCK32_007101 [Trichostrongylus colubriformis]|uniref:Transmembrane protein n=1 Tax=Trichostrongylus colubriformis TaxID=6319 RepID=A0AAN8FLT3_TRICO